VLVVCSLNENTWHDYGIGFPQAGRWLEIFNSDVYDNWVNPAVAGNGGEVDANGPPMHGLAHSAALTIPANGLLVFARGWSRSRTMQFRRRPPRTVIAVFCGDLQTEPDTRGFQDGHLRHIIYGGKVRG
jgi:hypothetical protein